MAFSEKIKLDVKKKAMFRCCCCQSVGIDVHHIVPQQNSGPDTIENAAPLCQNCHDQFGDNPIKRKEITQMRDHWYLTVERMYPNRMVSLEKPIQELSDKLDLFTKNQEGNLTDIKQMLKQISNRAIDQFTSGTIVSGASVIVSASAPPQYPSGSPTVLGGSPAFLPKSTHCTDCGKPRDNELYSTCNECSKRRGLNV